MTDNEPFPPSNPSQPPPPQPNPKMTYNKASPNASKQQHNRKLRHTIPHHDTANTSAIAAVAAAKIDANGICNGANRTKILKKMGVSEDDVLHAEILIAQIPPPSHHTKIEKVMGYDESRLKREKATKLMGTSEDEIETENAKEMASLGIAGRRRSFSLTVNNASHHHHHHHHAGGGGATTAMDGSVAVRLGERMSRRRTVALGRRHKRNQKGGDHRHSTGDIFSFSFVNNKLKKEQNTAAVSSDSDDAKTKHDESKTALEELAFLRDKTRLQDNEISALRARLESIEECVQRKEQQRWDAASDEKV
eukprot:CAMPEP_0172492178 /NCGR_PEP_ID=MMETSP1066-20121228/23216_1 /TAXON_ID=671091 /ORGANISM="Coscinodiscus wailesii, Strain CCMP2513" /LENGTH=306 /DNA_ID=CAMNT_0013261641 /DNA_START=77 /DNA_END=997 /DNA_ORIENTATION=+